MNAVRTLMFLAGAALVVLALIMLFFVTNLDNVIPISFLVVGILLFVGVAIMSMADRGDTHRETIVEEHHHGGHHH